MVSQGKGRTQDPINETTWSVTSVHGGDNWHHYAKPKQPFKNDTGSTIPHHLVTTFSLLTQTNSNALQLELVGSFEPAEEGGAARWRPPSSPANITLKPKQTKQTPSYFGRRLRIRTQNNQRPTQNYKSGPMK